MLVENVQDYQKNGSFELYIASGLSQPFKYALMAAPSTILEFLSEDADIQQFKIGWVLVFTLVPDSRVEN